MMNLIKSTQSSKKCLIHSEAQNLPASNVHTWWAKSQAHTWREWMAIHSIAINCVGLVDSSNSHCYTREAVSSTERCCRGGRAVSLMTSPQQYSTSNRISNKVQTTKHIKICTSGTWGDIPNQRVYNLQWMSHGSWILLRKLQCTQLYSCFWGRNTWKLQDGRVWDAQKSQMDPNSHSGSYWAAVLHNWGASQEAQESPAGTIGTPISDAWLNLSFGQMPHLLGRPQPENLCSGNSIEQWPIIQTKNM